MKKIKALSIFITLFVLAFIFLMCWLVVNYDIYLIVTAFFVSAFFLVWMLYLGIFKKVRVAFIEGFKANNSLLELEKWVDENKYYFSGSAEIELLNKIQELKTKQ